MQGSVGCSCFASVTANAAWRECHRKRIQIAGPSPMPSSNTEEKCEQGVGGKKARKSQCLETWAVVFGTGPPRQGDGGVRVVARRRCRAPHTRHDLIRRSDWSLSWRDPALHMRHPRVGLPWRRAMTRDPALSSCSAPPRLARSFCLLHTQSGFWAPCGSWRGQVRERK